MRSRSAEDLFYPPQRRSLRRARRAEVPGHRATMAQAAGLYPFVGDAGLDLLDAPKVGNNAFGGPFHFSAREAYLRGVISSPNVAVFGALGVAKSGLCKSVFLDREAGVWGRRGFVLDLKREYLELASAFGVKPITLVPGGGGVRINFLGPEVPVLMRHMLCKTICAATIGSDLTVGERNMITWALRLLERRQPTDGVTALPALRDLLYGPAATAAGSERARSVAAMWDELAAARRTTSDVLRREARNLADAVEELCEAEEIRGMFDGPTTDGLDLHGRVVVLDIGELENAPPHLLAIAMAIAMTWLRGASRAPTTATEPSTVLRQWTFILDEAWHALTVPQVALFVRLAFKLARAWGWQNVVVMHRLSDMLGVADEGTAHAEIVRGLLSDTQVRVIYRQPPEQVRVLQQEFSLSDTQCRLIPTLVRGRALWLVSERSFLVDHLIGEGEKRIVDTDAAMRQAARRPRRQELTA